MDEARVLYERGKRLYESQRYKPAIVELTKSAQLCPCNRQTRRPRCTCKDFEAVAERDGDIFQEAMFNCTCEVGQTYSKCDQDLHLSALNARAVCLVTLKELVRAAKDASWMIELSPRKVEGYLRLSQIARLQDKDRFAWSLCGALLGIARAQGRSHEVDVQNAHVQWSRLQFRFAKRDPMTSLPVEIIGLIFGHFGLNENLKCLRVSKTWRGILTSRAAAPLWRTLVFNSKPGKRVPSMASLRKLASYSHNDVRRLVIKNAKRFGLDSWKLGAILAGSPRIEHVDVRYANEVYQSVPDNTSFKQLKYLRIDTNLEDEAEQDQRSRLTSGILLRAAQSLCHLRLNGLPEAFDIVAMPSLPSLRYFHCESGGFTPGIYTPFQLCVPTLVKQMPLLEGLALHNILLVLGHFGREKGEKSFSHLHTLIARYDAVMNANRFRGIAVVMSSERGHNLRHLDFQAPHESDLGDVVLPAFNPLDSERQLENSYPGLEVFRLKNGHLPPNRMQGLLQEPVRKGILSHIDITFPQEEINPVRSGARSCTVISEHEWLRGSESIRSLGLNGFHFRKFATREADMPLPGFVASFPNLEALEIDAPSHHEEEDALLVVKDILKAAQLQEREIRTIQVAQLKGFALEKLRVLAQEFGVEAIPEQPPRHYWPRTAV